MKCLSLVLPPLLLLHLSVSPRLSENKLFLHCVVSLKLHGCSQPPPCSCTAYSPNCHSSRSKSLSCELFNIRNCLCICQFKEWRQGRLRPWFWNYWLSQCFPNQSPVPKPVLNLQTMVWIQDQQRILADWTEHLKNNVVLLINVWK